MAQRFFRESPARRRGGFRLVVDDLYYNQGEAAPVVKGIAFSEEVLERLMRDIYNRKFSDGTDIHPETFRELWRTMDMALGEGFAASAAPDPDDDFRRLLSHSNAVFSAFKVHRMQGDMARQLLDANGDLKPFNQWLNDVQPIASHQCGAWLQTEYDTAVIRAHQAADWQQFLRERDVLPNLKWMPSTSLHPGADHRVFWNTVRPIDDAFWDEHRPGDRWNCKCTLTSTDDPATTVPDATGGGNDPQRGLENNPGKDAAVFSDNHPYFPSDCRHCDFYKPGLKARLRHVFRAKEKNCFNCPYIDGCLPGTERVNTKAAEHIKEVKQTIDVYNGVNVIDDSFATGQMTLLRRSLSDVYEHNREDPRLMQWLADFELDDLRGWKYEGWAENRPYDVSHPKYDPNNPNKKKHPETDYFLYYSLKIGGKKYWANVKMHNHYHAEVLYTIEKERPTDLIRGVK